MTERPHGPRLADEGNGRPDGGLARTDRTRQFCDVLPGSVSSLLLLAAASVLEAAGDAIVRAGLHGSMATAGRLAIILLGGVVLLGYGVLVNTPSWSFGRLLGVYVVFFFVAAQLIDTVMFGAALRLSIVAGGLLIVAGGVLLTIWR